MQPNTNPEIEVLSAEVKALRSELQALTKAQVKQRKARVRGLSALLGLLIVSGVVTAVAQQATDSLNVFTAGQPALASEVNHNFALLKQWLEQKVGTVGTEELELTGDITSDPPDTNLDGERGMTFRWGGDFAFFGQRQRQPDNPTKETMNTAIVFGDDSGDEFQLINHLYNKPEQVVMSATSAGTVNVTKDVNAGGDITATGAVTGATVNGKTLSGSGLACHRVTERSTDTSDDHEITAKCNDDEEAIGCNCYSSWNDCDGAYTTAHGCTVRASGNGNWLEARAVCCKVQ